MIIIVDDRTANFLKLLEHERLIMLSRWAHSATITICCCHPVTLRFPVH